MKLEDQVCSFELAKQLKELGVKQESYFYWDKKEWADKSEDIIVHLVKSWESTYSAFTVAELGLLLPNGRWTEEKCMGGFRLFYIEDSGKEHHIYFYDEKSEANARAKMLIYLIENKLMSVN